jgi:DNA-binding NtrC family response regulator
MFDSKISAMQGHVMREHGDDSLTTLDDVPTPSWFHQVGSVRDCYVLTLIEHGRTTSRLIFPPSFVVVGRGPGVDLEVDGRLASRRHVALHFGDQIDVEDLGSRNGTTVGETRLSPQAKHRLQEGESVMVGLAIIMLQKMPIGCVAPTILNRDAFLDGVSELPATARGIAIVKFTFARVVDPAWLAGLLANVFTGAVRLADWGGNSWRLACIPEDEKTTKAASDFAIARLAACGLHATSDSVFLPQPIDDELLRQHPILSPEVGAKWTNLGIVAHSKQTQEVLELAERVAKSDLAILILGETGVGKDLVASVIHDSSPRAGHSFLRLNCATLNEALLESELFGHEAGAFTGAKQTKKGLLEIADGGTVFLDEVAELPLTVQAKLLRAVEMHQFMRVGGGRVIPANVRFVSATNCDLLNATKTGKFREDLYYRLAGFTLHVPPLRERPDDIQVLAETFLHRVASGVGRVLHFSNEALTTLRAHPWPGNVRELKNVVVRAALLCDGPSILLRHLTFDQPKLATLDPRELPSFDNLPKGRVFPFHDPVAAREFISCALESAAGNQTQAAKMLGISRRALVNRLKEFGFPRPRIRTGNS